MKNILILTVDCWNINIGSNSSHTYSNLFSSMDGYKLSNVYIREELPNDPCCSRYFQISENRVLKSLYTRKIKTGREVQCGEPLTAADTLGILQQKSMYHKQRARFYYAKKLIREIVWLFAGWKSRELDDFLQSVKPDVVIYAMEGYIHFNRICRYVLQKTGAKGIGYFWDDNFTYKQRPHNIGYKVLRFFQRCSLKKLSKSTSAFWAISPKTKGEADAFFHINCKVLPKPAERMTAVADVPSCAGRKPIKMVYAGNLMIGRMETIAMVARVLSLVNRTEEKIRLDVYTPTVVPERLLQMGNGVFFHDAVSQQDVLDIQQQADVLLFAEDVVGENRKVARLSFSTKIPDYLSCRKCIIAIGDADTAPMEYFRQEDIALCADNEVDLHKVFELILNEPSVMDAYADRAYKCAQKNHAKEYAQGVIRDTINGVMTNEGCAD